MKHSLPLILSVVFLFSTTAQGQNLVPNGGFEEGVNCPTFIGNLDEECDSWYASISLENDPDPTPDWYHACSGMDVLSTPSTAFGYQVPYAGDGYGGIVTYRKGFEFPGYREYISVKLNEPLVVGQNYLVEFQVSRLYSGATSIACDKLGFNFTGFPFFISSEQAISNQSVFAMDTVLTDTTDWHKVEVVFTADSSYDYLHIGNFFDDNVTEIFEDGDFGTSAYYVIDDVSVSATTLSAGAKPTGLRGMTVFPNPARDVVRIRLKNCQEFMVTCEVTDLMGNTLKMYNGKDWAESIISLHGLPSGLHLLHIETNKNKYYEKLLKVK